MNKIYRELFFMPSSDVRKCIYMLIEGQANINGLEVEFFQVGEEEIESLTMPTEDFLQEAPCYDDYNSFWKSQLDNHPFKIKGD